MHFYTSQLCLHSRDVYFTTKIHLYCSPRFECFTSSILLGKMCNSICKFTSAVLLAFTVSILLFSSLRLFHFYCSPHFGCFTATVHLALIKQAWNKWTMTSTVRRPYLYTCKRQMSTACNTIVPDLCPRLHAKLKVYTTTVHESQRHDWLNNTWWKTWSDHSCTLLNAKCSQLAT